MPRITVTRRRMRLAVCIALLSVLLLGCTALVHSTDGPSALRTSTAAVGVDEASMRVDSWHYGTVRQRSTLAFMKAIRTAFPELAVMWVGDDFCAWTGVLCVEDGVHVDVSARRLSGKMPELSDLLDGSMVMLKSISLAANPRVHGTLPTSWAGLDTVEYISVAETGVSGSVPLAWYAIEALKALDISDTAVTVPAAAAA